MQGEAHVHIQAPPHRVYDLLTDVTRMGEWSPECYKCEWADGATGAVVGARFKGYNKRGRIKWTTKPKVLVAEPGREFSFGSMMGPGDGTRWTYRLEPAADGGTELTESFQAPTALKMFFRKRDVEMTQGMEETLARLKQAAESSA